MKPQTSSKFRFLQSHAKKLVRIAEKTLAKGKLDAQEQREKLERRMNRVQKILTEDFENVTEEQFDRTVRKLEKVLIVNDIWSPKGYFREIAEAFIVAAVIAIFVRSFVAEPFKIPTGSMIPTLEIDDFIFVTKFDYGLRLPLTQTRIIDGGTPVRGDVVVFDFPGSGEDKGKNFIKRVVGVPGDKISIRENVVHVNGDRVPRTLIAREIRCSDGDGGLTSCFCDSYEEQMGSTRFIAQYHSKKQKNPMCHNAAEWPLRRPTHEFRQIFELAPEQSEAFEILVPESQYLVMGDNRDNSHDGRYWGFVPYDALKGKAWIIWLARNKSRIFTSVHQNKNDGDVAHAATKRTNAP